MFQLKSLGPAIHTLIAMAGLLLGTGSLAAGPTPSASDWPTWRGDATRSAAISAPLPETLHLLWTRSLGTPAPAWPADQHKIRFDESYEPVVAGKRLFVGSMVTDSLTAYDTVSGRELWRFYTGGPIRFAPLVWRDRVYTVSDDGYLYCLDTATGRLNWSKHGAPVERLILGNDRLISAWPVRGAPVLWEENDGGATLYFAAGIWPFMGTFIHALDAETGQVRWTNSGSGSEYVLQQHGSPAFAGVAPQGCLAVSDDILLVSGGRTVPAGYNRHTGEFLFFDVSSRLYGKDAGGHEVGIAGDFIFNHGCLYDLTNGTAVLNLNDKKIIPARSVAPIGDGFAAVTLKGSLAWYGTALETVSAIETDRKGVEKRVTRSVLPLLQTVATNLPARQVHFRAGDRVYLSGAKGWIGAVDLAPAAHPGLAWEMKIEGDIWTLLPGDGKLFAVTREGELFCFGEQPSAGGPKRHERPSATAALRHEIAGVEGYAMVWGLGGDDDEARLTRLADRHHVIAVDPDPARVAALRRRLDDAGLYASFVHVLEGDPSQMPLPPYLATRIEVRADAVAAEAAVSRAWRTLRPYGGIAELHDATPPAPRASFFQRLRRTHQKKSPAIDAITAFTHAAEPLKVEGASVERILNGIRLSRPGALPQSASWTHQYADPANSVVSQDELVKPPLGLLWFGGPSNEDILPRHGHGPSPQVVGGRLFIEGPHALRAVDVYTGRLIWQRALPDLGKYYDNTSHQPGANEIGGNYVSLADGIYVVHDRRCLKLDPATGETLAEFTLPNGDDDEPPYWGYVGVYEELLIAGAAPVAIKAGKKDEPPTVTLDAQYASSSARLAVMNRHDGRVLWERKAEQGFRHNAIVAAAGKVFCIDGLSQTSLDLLKRRGEAPSAPAALLALDARTGQVTWRSDDAIFGTWLGYSHQFDILLESGSPARDRAKDEAKGLMAAYNGADGHLLWREKVEYAGKPMLHDATIYTEGAAFELLSGRSKQRIHPLTGRPMKWSFARNYGCNTPIGGRHMLLFRSAAAGFYDLTTDGGTGNWGGFKSGCTANLIPADGVLSAPDYTRTCTCSYQNQCSLALTPMSDVELWTFQGYEHLNGPVVRAGINFGAPGDWPAPDGTLWLDHPVAGGKGPNLKVSVSGEATYYRGHALEMTGEARQVTASGLEGAVKIRIPLLSDAMHGFTVSLHFAEPTAKGPGERSFDVLLQGEPVIEQLDIFAAAGGARRGLIRTFSSVAADKALTIELKSVPGSSLAPLLCGIKIVREDALATTFDLQTGVGQPTVWSREGHIQGIQTISNRTERAVTVAVKGVLAGVELPARRLELLPRCGTLLPIDVPVSAINNGEVLAASFDLGEDFGQFYQFEESYPLEAIVPLEVAVTVPSLHLARLELVNTLADQAQTPRLTVSLDGNVLLEQEVLLVAGATATVPCKLPAGLLGQQKTLEMTAQWADDFSPVLGRFTHSLDFRNARLVVPRRPTDAVAAIPPAATLDKHSGIFPEDRRKRVQDADDMQAEIDWWWDGEALVITAAVHDNLHFNTREQGNIWDGDAMQVAIAPVEGPFTSLALGLTEEGPVLWRYAGDKDLVANATALVTRDESIKETRYFLRLPLDSLGMPADPGTIFGINIVLLDDDDGEGYLYWRQITPGLAGGVNTAEYHQQVLGE